jgi:hypothetical protein
MDQQSLRRAALITPCRAIYERFPPGRERDSWLTFPMRELYGAAVRVDNYRILPPLPTKSKTYFLLRT